MQRPTPDLPYWFPEVLAAHTLLTRLGYDPDDVYYGCFVDPTTGVECMGVEVRPPTARGKASTWQGVCVTLALDPIDLVLAKTLEDAFGKFIDDGRRWNASSQEHRQTALERSAVRARAVEIIALLELRGLRPTGPVAQ